ncbi:methionyl-tRNA formyltransferase [Paenibacillus wenxiniae]|uniref:Methionyl-tRNA formyltransferase n=1 Tax=Paenibacillus wenxiniae TaxID=1636843 RepID=A0ABW4RHR7_9BACL
MNKTFSLYLMNEKGYTVLEHIIQNVGSDHIEFVISSEDKNVIKDYYSEIKCICQENNIPIYNRLDAPKSNSEFSFAIGWRWIINTDSKLIVFHDSLLPKYRGFSPLVNALVNGEDIVGVTALYATEEYDEGDIIGQQSMKVRYPIKIQDAIKDMSTLYSNLALDIVERIVSEQEVKAVKQDNAQATYSLWRDEQDYEIDWNQSAHDIKRFIDATGFPFKGAKTTMDGMQVRVFESEVIQDVVVENRTPGKVIFMKEGFPVIVCKEGLLKIVSMRDELNNSELIPMKKFRVRFK